MIRIETKLWPLFYSNMMQIYIFHKKIFKGKCPNKWECINEVKKYSKSFMLVSNTLASQENLNTVPNC